jgi:NAD(P)-dependent dehydrogenase (short-subunit alcohol dehydrogenase family)
MGLLEGRVSIVTGGAGNLGAHISRLFAAEGASVVINDVNVDKGRALANELGAVFHATDVSTFAGGRELVARAVDEFGTVDALALLAGRIPLGPLADVTEDEWDGVVDSHLKGHFTLIQAAAPVMKEKGYGRIVNITSSAGLRGNFGQTNYGAAKAAIMGMTFVWAIELGKYGITVNAMSPAGATRMTASLFERTGTEPPPEANPALNAPIVTFLASEGAAHVNGQIVGRTDFAYTIYQTPKQVGFMWRDGGWEVDGVVDNFDSILGQHMQHVGMTMPSGMEHKK